MGRKFLVPILIASVFGLSSCNLQAKIDPRVTIVEQSLVAYQDFPKPGINFYDVSGILKQPAALHAAIDILVEHYQEMQVDAILALDARGFLFATPVAYQLKIPVVMLRKPGKLPGEKISSNVNKEYGNDALEMQKGAISPGQKIVIIDDLIATGGTIQAAIKLAHSQGAEVVEAAAIVQLKKFMTTRALSTSVFTLVTK